MNISVFSCCLCAGVYHSKTPLVAHSHPVTSSLPMNQQDNELMTRVADDDEAAIQELITRFSPLLFKVAWQFNPSNAEAEDAVQEIFIRLWRTADRYDPKRAKLVTWVMLLARRYLIDRLRRASSRPRTMVLQPDHERPEKDGTSSEAGMLKNEQSTRLMARIDQLPDMQKIVIERTYLLGYTLREVSQQINAPLGTVKSALSRGLARLREQERDTAE